MIPRQRLSRPHLIAIAVLTAAVFGCGKETGSTRPTEPLQGQFRTGWESARFSHVNLSNESLRVVTADLERLLSDWQRRDTEPDVVKRVQEEASVQYDFAVAIPQQELALLLLVGKTAKAQELVASYRKELELRDAHPASLQTNWTARTGESATPLIRTTKPSSRSEH